jgi:hypothetical protein
MVPAIVDLVLLDGNACYVILVDVIQMLTCFNDWSNISFEAEV